MKIVIEFFFYSSSCQAWMEGIQSSFILNMQNINILSMSVSICVEQPWISSFLKSIEISWQIIIRSDVVLWNLIKESKVLRFTEHPFFVWMICLPLLNISWIKIMIRRNERLNILCIPMLTQAYTYHDPSRIKWSLFYDFHFSYYSVVIKLVKDQWCELVVDTFFSFLLFLSKIFLVHSQLKEKVYFR